MTVAKFLFLTVVSQSNIPLSLLGTMVGSSVQFLAEKESLKWITLQCYKSLKLGQPGLFPLNFAFFQENLLINFTRIQTRIGRLEGVYANHETTTMTLKILRLL